MTNENKESILRRIQKLLAIASDGRAVDVGRRAVTSNTSSTLRLA